MNLFKKNGISTLISAQNEEKTIKDCVESFLRFSDEIIIVTNGSSDNTRDICRQLMNSYPEKVRFYDKPELSDLFHNRAYALSKVRYRWVMRGDADYIAYNKEDGKHDIQKLRQKILNTSALYPTVFYLEQINLYYKPNLTGISKELRENIGSKNAGHYVPPTIAGNMPRVYLNTPLLKFKRLGRMEGVPYIKYYKKVYINKPYWFHLTIKSDKDLFYRSERTNWRELGDYSKFPHLEDYIYNYVLPTKYKKNIDEAIKEYIDKDVMPYLEFYEEDKYYPYPNKLKEQVKNGVY